MDELSIYYPTTITAYPSKLIVSTDDFVFSYYRNRNNKICRGLTFLNTNDILTLSPKEQADVLAVAREVYDSQTTIGLNDFEYLQKLEHLYFSGNYEAQQLYPYILQGMPLDGAGSHFIEYYGFRYWAFDNRGEVEL